MKKEYKFNYIIIGGGLAGMQLALAFASEIFFEDKIIAIIEPSDKIENDKVWSFWEDGESKWDNIVHHSWKKGEFISNKKKYPLHLGTYSYKTIRSEDFYKHAKRNLSLADNIVWMKDRVTSIENDKIIGETNHYIADYIFDSRVSVDFSLAQKAITIHQHFVGWVIETEENVFCKDVFTMMDYRLGYKDTCCFTYVLPFAENRALIEFTFFTPNLVDEKVYEQLLKEYINQYLRVNSYRILEKEKGNIPMSTYPFWKDNSFNYLKIGTGGGWVKASSGYSFKSVENKVAQVVNNLKFDYKLDNGLFNKRHIFYDKILLHLLYFENGKGKQIFEEMYRKNKATEIFEFLDEETTFVQELKIINRFSKAPFLRALKRLIEVDYVR